jgi:tRNA dimethylallyltransferase
MSGKQLVLALLGPTAVGKTALSLRIARRFHCEIISLDSMQVYRLLNVGTAKIRPEERQGIAHYCLDLVDPDEDYDAARYARDAQTAIATIRQRGKIPLLVGGAGLYLRALEDGLFAAPQRDEKIRKKLNIQLNNEGIEKLHERLAACDPISAARIDRHDHSRIIRALEIYLATGKPLSEHLRLQRQAQQSGALAAENYFIKIGLDCERRSLYQRINERCQNMLAEGLIEETREALAAGYAPDCKALNAIGYRHVIARLRGESDYEKMLDIFMRDTRHYAKRQLTWFRHDPTITWFDWQMDEAICDFIAKKLEDVCANDCASNH